MSNTCISLNIQRKFDHVKFVELFYYCIYKCCSRLPFVISVKSAISDLITISLNIGLNRAVWLWRFFITLKR